MSLVNLNKKIVFINLEVLKKKSSFTPIEKLFKDEFDFYVKRINDNVLKYQRSFTNVLNFELSNMRSAFNKRKNRSTVSGGNKKPYAQKGSGRARVSSIRANH